MNLSPLMAVSLNHLCINPSATKLAFWKIKASLVANEYLSDLEVVDLETSTQSTLVSIIGVPSGLSFSTDEIVVYAIGHELWAVTGGENQLLCRLPGGIRSFSLSHASKDLYCGIHESGSAHDPWVFDGLPLKRDGRGYLTGQDTIWRITPSGQSNRLPLGTSAWSPVISPDGTKLLFLETANTVQDLLDASLRLLDLRSGTTTTLRAPRGVLTMCWAPDSSRFAMVGKDSTIGTPVPPSLYVSNEYGAVQPIYKPSIGWLGASDGADWRWPSAHPTLSWLDPSAVIVGETIRAQVQLSKISLDGDSVPLTTDAADFMEAITDYRTGRLWAIRHDFMQFDEVVAIHDRPISLTAVNSYRLTAPEEFYIEGGQGHLVHTFLLSGRGSYQGTILAIHGGPHNSFTRQPHVLFQALAECGFNVVWANPHGSIGYGVDYAEGLTGQWGVLDEQDWASIVASLAQRNCRVDRLGVMGTSYGGFMATWLLGHWPHIKAACIQAPITNQLDMLWASDIGYTFTMTGCAVNWDSPDEAMARLWENSPLRYASNITAPVLLLHGREDQRCPLAHSESLYTLLQMRHVPCELVVYPGESHLMTTQGSPTMRQDRFHRIISWFNRYLASGETKPIGPKNFSA